MVKWVVKAMEPGTTNLHEFLQYRISLYQPYQGGNWQPSLEFFTMQGHYSRQGSLGWNRTTQAWKVVLSNVKYIPTNCLEDLLNCNIWTCPEVPLIGPGFSRLKASNLHKKGPQKYSDIMRGSGFIPTHEIQHCFGLKQEEREAWEAVVQVMTRRWQAILSMPQQWTSGGEWVGIYQGHNTATLSIVVQTKEAFMLKLGVGIWWIPLSAQTFSVNLQSIILSVVPEEYRLHGARWDARGKDIKPPIIGYMHKVCVVLIKRGTNENMHVPILWPERQAEMGSRKIPMELSNLLSELHGKNWKKGPQEVACCT